MVLPSSGTGRAPAGWASTVAIVMVILSADMDTRDAGSNEAHGFAAHAYGRQRCALEVGR